VDRKATLPCSRPLCRRGRSTMRQLEKEEGNAAFVAIVKILISELTVGICRRNVRRTISLPMQSLLPTSRKRDESPAGSRANAGVSSSTPAANCGRVRVSSPAPLLDVQGLAVESVGRRPRVIMVSHNKSSEIRRCFTAMFLRREVAKLLRNSSGKCLTQPKHLETRSPP
jgi:hypothetical protein